MKKMINDAEINNQYETAEEESAMDYVDETGDAVESKESRLKKLAGKAKAAGKWTLEHGAKFGIGAGVTAGLSLGIAKIFGYELINTDRISSFEDVVDTLKSSEAVSEVVENATETISDVVSE